MPVSPATEQGRRTAEPRHQRWRSGTLLGLLLMALGATAVAAQPASDSPSLVTLDEQIDRMSSDEKIAQLMIVGISPLMAGAEAERPLAGWRFGGVVLYASNLRTVAQVRQLTAAIRRAGGPI